jgi:NitT/TauT family transport system ATP-binding protein
MKVIDIAATDLSVCFKQGLSSFVALENVEIECLQGQFVSILGPSGCGKSTLLKVLAGLLTPHCGQVWRNANRIKRGVGYVPQSHQLLPWRTLLQNAFIGCEIAGAKYTSASIERVNYMIDRFRLSGFENCYPHVLSGGMAQRVSLIRALQASPGLLFCDEPFSAVDFVSRFEFNVAFKAECSAKDITCIMVTHNIEEAIYLSDKIVLMGGAPGTTIKEYASRNLPNRSNPILCRQSHEFNEFFNEIWRDLNDSYKSSS